MSRVPPLNSFFPTPNAIAEPPKKSCETRNKCGFFFVYLHGRWQQNCNFMRLSWKGAWEEFQDDARGEKAKTGIVWARPCVVVRCAASVSKKNVAVQTIARPL